MVSCHLFNRDTNGNWRICCCVVCIKYDLVCSVGDPSIWSLWNRIISEGVCSVFCGSSSIESSNDWTVLINWYAELPVWRWLTIVSHIGQYLQRSKPTVRKVIALYKILYRVLPWDACQTLTDLTSRASCLFETLKNWHINRCALCFHTWCDPPDCTWHILEACATVRFDNHIRWVTIDVQFTLRAGL